MDIQQTTVKTDMQSDENSGEEGDARANLGGDQKVIGFLTEWVSAYNFIKGMVLIKQTLFSKQASELLHGSVPHSYSSLLSLLLALEKKKGMSSWMSLSMLPFSILQWHGTNFADCEFRISIYFVCNFRGYEGTVNAFSCDVSHTCCKSDTI